jgi:hypothetical protein
MAEEPTSWTGSYVHQVGNPRGLSQAEQEYIASAKHFAETLATRQGGEADRQTDTCYLIRDRGGFVIGLWADGIGYDCTPTRR